MNKMQKENTDIKSNIISYSLIKKCLPARYEYLNPEDYAKINEKLNNNEDMLFLPTYLKETHMQDKMYDKAKYKIILNGIFTDGRRVNVIIDDIEPYFEVRIPKPDDDNKIKVGRGLSAEYLSESEYINKLRLLLNNDDITTPIKTSRIKGKPFKYYQDYKNTYIRFYYIKTKNRKIAIKTVRQAGYETAHDDEGSYYRVVCRDYLTTFSMWAVLTNYKETTVDLFQDKNNINTYRLSIDDFKKYDGDMTPELLRDKTLSMTWDIETWSPEGNVPLPENKQDCMFCIGMTFQWVNDNKPFLQIALVDYPSNPKPDYLTIVCQTENNIIKAFGDIFEKMRPEFIMGFNDSDYDWNWLINRACETKGLVSRLAKKMSCTVPWKSFSDDVVMKYNFKKEHVKVEADMYADGYSLMMDGYIPIDVRTIFRKLYPTAESSSLKWFLSKNKLGSKEDMPYQTMFKIYAKMRKIYNLEGVNFNEEGSDFDFDINVDENIIKEYHELKEQMADVNKYCVVDALRCHELCKIRSVIMDHREVSNVAYTSVYDAFYRANGMKVRNLTIAVGQDKNLPFGIRFTNITNLVTEEGKYPGAYVFPPKKGLQISKLSIKERIKKAELTKDTKRPSMQDWLNTDNKEIQKFYKIIEKYGPVITNQRKIDEVEEAFGKLPKKFHEFLKEFTGRPITGLDFASLYPSLIRCYNFSPEFCIKDKSFAKKIHNQGQKLIKVDFDFSGSRRKAWFVWHNNKLDPKDPEFQFGVYPYILNDLFFKRKGIKKQMNQYGHEIEQMEAKSDEYLKENAEHYENIKFQYNYLNSKQLALKVFMNTFYGEAGNKLSPFFVVEVAGGITTYGQKNIKMAKQFVENQGNKVFYGDTDSLYIACANRYFESIDKLYYTEKMDKLTYWTELVNITFEIIKKLNEEVNDMFFEDNGTKFLTMAYEEALFPVAYTAKKKYFGIPHENIPNFKPKSLFIRGLEVKKRGVSDLLKKNFNEIIWTACTDLDNLYTLMELSLNKIDDIYTNRIWCIEDFIQTDVFRPNKNNIKIHTFVNRMKERNIPVPANERFQYIIVKKYPYIYDHRGRKKEISAGDKMEFVDIVKEQNLEVDLDYYMKGSVNGQLARLVVYHSMFHVEPLDDSSEELNIAEEKMFKNATKFINEYASQYYSEYHQFGKVYQKMFRTANKLIGDKIKTKDELTHQLITANAPDTGFEEWFIEYIDKKAIKSASTYGPEYVADELQKIPANERPEKIKIMQKVYYDERMRDSNNKPIKSILKIRTNVFNETMSILRRKLRENMSNFRKIYSKYQSSIENVTNILKSALNINEDLYKSTKNSEKYTLEDFGEIDDDLLSNLEKEAKKEANNLLNDEKMQTIISNLKELYINILSAHLIYRRTQSIVDTLKSKRNSYTRTIMRPDDDYMRNIINSSIKESIENSDDLGMF